jgi:hypothetical protein
MITRFTRAGLLAAVTCIACSGLAVAGELGQVRSFRDWIVGCDNTRTCRAMSLPAIAEPGKAALRIDRGGGSRDAARTSLILPQTVSVTDGSRLTISPDTGEIIQLVVGREARVIDDDVTVVDDQVNRKVLAAIRGAGRFALTLLPQHGEPIALGDLSLTGASAALLWMEERQGRVGANAPAGPPPAVPSMPRPRRFAGAEPPAQLPEPLLDAVLGAYGRLPAGSCEETPDGATQDMKADRLAPGLLLVGLRCLSGAYNVSHAYFIVREGARPQVRPAAFPRMRVPAPAAEQLRSESQPDNILWNAEIDDATGTMSHLAKGRGFADCGEMGSWRWDGRAFQPIELSIMPACRGLMPPNWITLYRTR